MGHIRLGVLPKYPRWKNVITLLSNAEATPAQVADKVLDGSRQVLESESAQQSVEYCIWLIAQLTLASRSGDFEANLSKLGIEVDERVSATEFLAKVSYLTSRHLSNLSPRNAINNIAGLSLREALTHTVGIQATTLFGTGLADVQRALKKYSTQKQFSVLLHVFFTAFLKRTLHFVVDKEITNHLGPGERFENVDQVRDFETVLESFAGQTSRIVDAFSGGWYSKRVWQQGNISEADAAGFVHIALNKLSADLRLNEAQP